MAPGAPSSSDGLCSSESQGLSPTRHLSSQETLTHFLSGPRGSSRKLARISTDPFPYPHKGSVLTKRSIQRRLHAILLLCPTIQRGKLRKNILSSTVHIIFGDTPLRFCWTHFSSRETLSKLDGRSVSSVFTLVDWIRIALRKSKDSFAFSFSIAPNRLLSHLLTNHLKTIILTAMNLNPHYVSSPHSVRVGEYAPFHRWGNWVTDSFSYLSKIPNKRRGRTSSSHYATRSLSSLFC